MKKLIGSLITSNRKTLLLASILLSVAVFGVVAWQSNAQSNSNETGDKIVGSPSSPQAGSLIISEFRLGGAGGANDEFIEIYNDIGVDHTVAAISGTGYGVAASDGVLRCTIPNGTVIPARGHFLCTNSAGYSYSSYPAGNGTTATGDATYTTDIPVNAGIALFDTNLPANFFLANRFDAVGAASEANPLYKEGTGYPDGTAATINTLDASYVRLAAGLTVTIPPFGGAPTNGFPQDTDNNAADFVFVDVNGTSAGSGQRLGAPGPENLSSPRFGGAVTPHTALDTCSSFGTAPNKVRDNTSFPITSTFGTIDLRRTFTNSTGASLNRLRIRLLNIATFPAAFAADLRAISSSDVVVTVDRPPCGAGTSNITVFGTTLEMDLTSPSLGQPNGGGFNSSFSVPGITPGTPLANGASVDVRFVFGVQQTGSYKIAAVAEGLPLAGDLWILQGNTDDASDVEGSATPATIAKAFSPTSIPSGGTSTVTLTLSNPNAFPLTGAAFTDPLTNMSAVGGAVGGTCTGTTPNTLAAGATALSFTGITIPAGSCTVTFAVTSNVTGTRPNTTSGVISTQTPVVGAASNTANLTVAAPQADLSITKTDGVTSAPAGSTVTYTLIASNAGPNIAPGSTVVDTFPAVIINAQWTCVSSAGSSCGAASGVGNINQAVNILVGGMVTYTVVATISPSATGTLSNTAIVTVPAGTTDPNPNNNTTTDVDTLLPPSVFVIDDVQKLEGQSGTAPFVFTVTKTGGTGFATAVQFQTQDGTATVADNDYQAASGILNFGPFDTQKTITVLVNGDTNIEPNETFFVRLLANPVNALLSDGGGQGTILNEDPAPTPTPTPTPPNRFEGDINRTAVGAGGTGDGDVNVGDQIQYLKFLNGTDCPSTNEQPRLDAGPRVPNLGDGLLGAADGTAIDAYARHDASTDFDPNTPGWQPTPAGGPTTITNLGCTPSAAPESEDAGKDTTVEPASATAARVIRVVSRSGARNSDITVDIEMIAQGNEAGTQYGLHFDPAVLSISDVSGVNANPDIMLGAGAPEGTTLNVNAADAANGNIGIVENFSAAAITALPEGATRIARVRFHVLDGGASGTSRVDFDSSVINGVTSDVNGMVLSANYEGGDVSVSSSRGVTVSGRVISSDGRGIRGATVTIVDGDGFARTATTSSFGYYAFDDVAAATYTIAVSSRQYRFGSRTITVGDNLADVDFTGSE